MSNPDQSVKQEIVVDRMEISNRSTSPPSIVQFVIENRINGGQWTEVGRVAANQQNFSMADFVGGIEYECRIVAVDGDGCRRIGGSSSFQISSMPKILAPISRIIPIQVRGRTQFDVKYSGYPPPSTLWTDINGEPLSEKIRCQYSNSGGQSISSLLISPLEDGLELKSLKFKIENSLGKDEVIFDLVVANVEPPAIYNELRKIKRQKFKLEKGHLKVRDLRVTKAHGCVEISWAPPIANWGHFNVERKETGGSNMQKWTVINSRPITETKYRDYKVAVDRIYRYRVMTVGAQGKRVRSPPMIVSLMQEKPKEPMKNLRRSRRLRELNEKSHIWSALGQAETGIDDDGSGQNADIAGPSGQNTVDGTSQKRTTSMESECVEKIIKMEVNDEDEVKED